MTDLKSICICKLYATAGVLDTTWIWMLQDCKHSGAEVQEQECRSRTTMESGELETFIFCFL